MNSDEPLALNAASWPVLLVDQQGKILRLNKPAADLFDPNIVAAGDANLNAYWDAETGQSCGAFLNAGLAHGGLLTPVKFAISGHASSWLASVCRTETNRALMVQLFPHASVPETKSP